VLGLPRSYDLAPGIQLAVGIREFKLRLGHNNHSEEDLDACRIRFQMIINLCYLVILLRIPAMLSCINAVKLYQSHATQASPLKGTGQTNLQTPGRQTSSHRPAVA
jgi:hypothetical protein